MNRGEVLTVPSATGTGWWNMLDGKAVSKHRREYEAVAAGRAIAESLGLNHTIQEEGASTETQAFPSPQRGG